MDAGFENEFHARNALYFFLSLSSLRNSFFFMTLRMLELLSSLLRLKTNLVYSKLFTLYYAFLEGEKKDSYLEIFQ